MSIGLFTCSKLLPQHLENTSYTMYSHQLFVLANSNRCTKPEYYKIFANIMLREQEEELGRTLLRFVWCLNLLSTP